MLNKKGQPEIKPADRIVVEDLECVVCQVYGKFSVMGACEVVTNRSSPVCRDVCWDGQQWVFSNRPTFVDATKGDRLKPFIEML